MLIGMSMVFVASLMACGIALDWLLGEPRRWHPLVGFGNIAGKLERACNHGRGRLVKGVLAWALAVLPPVCLSLWLIDWLSGVHVVAWTAAHVVLLYFSLGLRSLRDHLFPIADALRQGDLARARELTARIVTRDTRHADAPDLAKAAVESLLENGNDAVFGTLFWFAVAGGPGALLFRLCNTLDAMWGYRNARFLHFGRMAARTDDVLNWIPARLTAASYAALGDTKNAAHCWKTQAAAWGSPNAGPVMSAGAGALGVALGGSAVYDGVRERRPPLGSGRIADANDIMRAWRLVAGSAAMWTLILWATALFIEGILHA